MRKTVYYAALSLFLACVMISAFGTSSPAADVKIGYANLMKALNESEAGLKAKEYLKEEKKKLEDALNTKQEELKKAKEEIDKKGSVWNKETLEAKEKDFRTKRDEFQKLYMDYDEQLKKKEQEKQGQILEDLNSVVEEVAKKKGLTYVFERSIGGILYAAPSEADITKEVIETYNKRYKGK